MESLTTIEEEATKEEVHKRPPAIINKDNKAERLRTRNHKWIQSPHYNNIFSPENQAALTPEEQNADIRAPFANDDYLPQEPELKQALGNYILV